MTFTNWFVQKYNRVPTEKELKELVRENMDILEKRYPVAFNKKAAFAEQKKKYGEYVDAEKEKREQ